MKPVPSATLLIAVRLALIPAVPAQTVVPVSPKFPPPAGLTFAGQWECKSGDLTARLQITPDRLRQRESMPSAQDGWAMLTESQQGLATHYLVGYDRDANEFLLLDADDPAYEAYRTEGWNGSTMTLTYVARPDKQMPANRFVYHADDSARFTVSWEEYENGEWTQQDTYTCSRSSRKEVRWKFRTYCHRHLAGSDQRNLVARQN
jgi:hypothetical protein